MAPTSASQSGGSDGTPHLTPGIDGLLFDFGSYLLSVFANADNDTLSWHERDVFPQYDGQIQKPAEFWRSYLGKTPLFIWEMKNQRGFLDALQFMFGPQDDGFMIVQLMTIASRVRIFSLTNGEIDGPRERADRNSAIS